MKDFLALAQEKITEFVALGGPVVAVLLVMSVVAAATVIYKTAQFRKHGVGRRASLEQALTAWDRGDKATARAQAQASRNHLKTFVLEAMTQANSAPPGAQANRLIARSEASLTRLEQGFRLLDSIAQLAPLLGLFGTVLGMIEAFQKLQGAGSAVDPSLLAGGIWVALMTTAVGLAVAMPTQLFLTWLETRVAGDRIFADKAIHSVICPAHGASRDATAHAA